jgi:hypothetical protein
MPFSLSGRYERWLHESDDDPWDKYIQELRDNAELLEIENVQIDVPAVVQRRFSCVSHECAPSRRDAERRSCCADLDVDLTPEEIRDLGGAFEPIRDFLEARDPLWKRRRGSGPRFTFESTMQRSMDYTRTLRRPRGRCVFSYMDGDNGLRCGVHAACIEHGLDLKKVKPRVCHMFPLLLTDLSDGRFFLTSMADSRNAPLIDFDDHWRYPCLDSRAEWQPLYREMRETLIELFGAEFYAALDLEASARLRNVRRTPPPKRKWYSEFR